MNRYDRGRLTSAVTLLIVVTLFSSLIFISPQTNDPVYAAPMMAPADIAWDMVNTTSQNLTSHTNVWAGGFTSAGDGFEKYQRVVSGSIPYGVLDDSAGSYAGDTIGIIGTSDLNEFFGVVDTVNGDTSGPVSATWEFDISSATGGLTSISIDMGGMKDFETSDTFSWAVSIDGGGASTVFSSTVDEAASHTYTMESGTSVPDDDPILMNGTILTNNLQTFTAPLSGTGSTLTLTLTANLNGSDEALAFRDIVIQGLTSGAFNAPIVPACPTDIAAAEGSAAAAVVGAADADSIVNGVTVDSVTPSDPGTINLSSIVPAGSAGSALVASLDVSDTTPVGTYTVTLEFSNADPQTETCEIAVEVAGIALIHDVQGAGASVTNPGVNVAVEGIVVGDFQGSDEMDGFFLQEETADVDADPMTSEGIFVYCGDPCVPTFIDVNVGDKVLVYGMQEEFFDVSQIDVTGGGSITLVAPASDPSAGLGQVTPATITLPVASLDVWEYSEGMLVSIPHTLHVTGNYTTGRYGEVDLSVGSRLYNPTNVAAPGAAASAVNALNDLSRIQLDDGSSVSNPTVAPYIGAGNTLRAGDTLPSITGVLHYAYGTYELHPTGPVTFTRVNTRDAAPEDVGGTMTVASFNVLNYFTTFGSRGADDAVEFARQRDKIISAIVTMDADIVGLMEIENHATDAALMDLVTGLNAVAGAGTYDYIATGPVGTDAIKVALIYQPGSVTPMGSHAILDSSIDPTFIDTKNRPALAQSFMEDATGELLTVVVNHLKSKGSACDDVGDPDAGDEQGNCNGTRTAAATALVNWLATDPTFSGDPDFLIIGDLNAYAMEDPIAAIEAGGYINLIATFIGLDAYSYTFYGEFGYLDHALSSSSLTSMVTGVIEWHINADEPSALNYNDYNQAYLYQPDAYAASDHDPVIVGLDMGTDDTGSGGTVIGTEATSGEPTIDDPAISKLGILLPGQLGIPGEQLEWVITVDAPTGIALTNVVVTDTLRPELEITGVTTTSGTASFSGQTVTVVIPTMAAGSTVEIRVMTTVLSNPDLGVINNTAMLQADGVDITTVTASVSGAYGSPSGLPSTGYPPAE